MLNNFDRIHKVDDVRKLLKSKDNLFRNDKCPEWFNDRLKQLEV